MRVLVLGAGGMIGQKLLASLAQDRPEAEVIAHDIAFPPNPVNARQNVTGSVTDPGAMEKLVSLRPDLIFHLASVVSGEAEQDFEKGWAVNMWPTWSLLEALRAAHE